MSKWNNIPGTVNSTISFNKKNELWETFEGYSFTDEVQSYLTMNFDKEKEYDLEINFLSSGYHYSAVMYLPNGDPGYPEESDDERTLDSIVIGDITLPVAVADTIFESYTQEVYEVVMESPDEGYNPNDCDEGLDD